MWDGFFAGTTKLGFRRLEAVDWREIVSDHDDRFRADRSAVN
jgi:hypothetical protein